MRSIPILKCDIYHGTLIAYYGMYEKGNTTKATQGAIDMKRILNITKTMEKKITICSMAILIACLWATASFASWSSGLNENGIYGTTTYNITKVEVFKLDGTSGFEGPGMSNLTPGSWTVSMPNANYVVATDATPGGTSYFGWLFSFTGASTDSLHLAYLAYTSTGEVFGTYINYNYGSSGLSFLEITDFNPNDPIYDRTPASAVPIPPTVFLFSGGLFSLVALRKKIKM
jgi:hypothetical protein